MRNALVIAAACGFGFGIGGDVSSALHANAQPALQQSLRGFRAGSIVVRHWPNDARLAESLIRTARRPLPALPPDLLDAPPDIEVIIAPDETRFDSLTGGTAPDWGAGVALPRAGLIILPGYESERGPIHDLPRVLRHELAHVALQRFLGPARIPIWFSEGYATWAAGQLDQDAGWILRIAFITGRAPPLDSLSLDWPGRPADARVAYLLAASAVGYLHENGGDRVFHIFLDHWKRNRDFERALRDTYGLDTGQLERYWSAAVRRRFGWLLFLAQSVVIWAITAAIVAVLVVIRRRRDRLRLARLRATEIPDAPAYWMPPEPNDVNEPEHSADEPDAGPSQSPHSNVRHADD